MSQRIVKVMCAGVTTASKLYEHTSADNSCRSNESHTSVLAMKDGMGVMDDNQAVEKYCHGIDTDYETIDRSSYVTELENNLELTKIVDFLSTDSSLLNSLFPSNLPAVDRELAIKSIFRTVRKVFDDPHLLAEITACDTRQETSLPHKNYATDTRDLSLRWNELVNDHKCIICSDLLACPVILGCSHSFCGSCVTEMREAWETDGCDMVYTCPTCRNEIETEIFERVLDDIIIQKVDQIPDCEPKKDWMKRRERYLKSRRAKSLEKELHKEDPSSPEYIIVAVIVIITLALAALKCLRGM